MVFTKQRSKKTVARGILMVVIFAFTFSTIACGIAVAAKKELTVWTVFTGVKRKTAMEALVDTFSEKYPDIKVVVNPVEGEAMKTVGTIVLSGTTPPDIILVHPISHARKALEAGLLMDLTSFWEEKGIHELFGPAHTEIVTWQGKIFQIPFVNECWSGFWFNTKLFAQHGIVPPQTWDELLEAAKILKANDIAPFTLGNRNQWAMPPWLQVVILRVIGKDFWDGLTLGTSHWDDPRVVKALGMIKELFDKDYFNPDPNAYSWEEAGRYWAEGGSAMYYMGSWLETELLPILPPEFTVDYFMFPTIDPSVPRVSVTQSLNWSLSTNALHPETAKIMLEYLASKEGQEIFGKTAGIMMCNRFASREYYSDVMRKEIEDSLGYPGVLGFDWGIPPEVFLVAFPAMQRFADEPTTQVVQEVLAEIEKASVKYFSR